MATAKELREQAEAARVAADSKFAEAKALGEQAEAADQAERAARLSSERTAHYRRMYDEIGQPLAGLNDKQHAIVYDKAYKMGYTSGYEDVEHHYGELAELVRAVIAAAVYK